MHKVTKPIEKSIALVAGQLPEATYQAATKIVKGSEILAKDPRAQAMGQLVKPNQMYRTLEEKPVNHVRRLRKAYENSGFAGVYSYCENYVHPELRTAFKDKLQSLF